MDDLISRQAAIDSIEKHLRFGDELYPLTDTDKVLNHAFAIAASCVYNLPSAQPERMTNSQWIDFPSVQFDISRSSAKEMLHGMMQCKKEDNFKKLFNGDGMKAKIIIRLKSGFELPITCDAFKINTNALTGEITHYDIKGIEDNKPIFFRPGGC